jgi:hypothetical protein
MKSPLLIDTVSLQETNNLRFKPNSLKALLTERRQGGTGQGGAQGTQSGTTPTSSNLLMKLGGGLATWMATPKQRRPAALLGNLAQSGFSPQAMADYEAHGKELMSSLPGYGLMGSLTSKLGKIPAVGGIAQNLVQTGFEEQLPTYFAAAALDPRVSAYRT